ncbi:MAG: hypothetical protein KC593_22865, partial [Myxococcales bacterium]|nr:hypothetical protein [Myxococcales bacterium]
LAAALAYADRAGEPSAERNPAPVAGPASAPQASTQEDAAAPQGPPGEPAGAATAPGQATLRRSTFIEWEKLVDRLEHASPALAGALEEAVPRLVNADRIVLAFHTDFTRSLVEQGRATLLAAAESHFGARPELQLEQLSGAEGATQSLASVSASRRDAAKNKRKHEALAHPMVLEAFDIFPDARGKAFVRFEA